MKKENTAIRLKKILEERNLKQVDILNLSKPYCEQFGIRLEKNDLSQYLSGKTEPGQNKLFILAKTLNVNEAWLMGFDVPIERVDNEDPTPNQRPSYEEMERLIEQAEQGNVGQHTLAYGGLLEEDEVTKTLNALEQLDSHSRDEYNILMELMNSKSGAVVFGYDAGEWKRETLTEKEAEVVFNLLHTLRK